MSDTEDYMSDKFLHGIEKSTSSSLIYRHADKRKFELMKKKTEIETKLNEKNSIKHIEEEKREAGLSSAITSSNKGYEMIMKMGYKPGQGIGKTGSGRIEPISLEVKLDRQGLGEGIAKKERKKKDNSHRDKLDNKSMKDFRDRIAQKRTEQLLKTDLYKSQKVCQKLDIQQEIKKPKEIWFWLPQDNEDDDNSDTEEDDDFLPVSEKLEILTKYLREKYFYCIWCGVAHLDEDDLRDNCPGDTRNDH
ncbi:G patch domain-containing protein 11 [Bombus terrestris]|uniref:G patch domain-containing protein 11 n=1 Tax=Bombus terrestris TaxID=30195 RepID=A0A9B2JWK3_BOMTE|nr:G patch domain-containing protein 11 [Bombus terrestris]